MAVCTVALSSRIYTNFSLEAWALNFFLIDSTVLLPPAEVDSLAQDLSAKDSHLDFHIIPPIQQKDLF